MTLVLVKALVWLEKSLTKHAVKKKGLFHRLRRLKRVEAMEVSHVVCLDASTITRRILSFLFIIFLTERAQSHGSLEKGGFIGTYEEDIAVRAGLSQSQISSISINTQVIIQNRALSLPRYLGLSADNHLDGQNGCQ